MFGAGHFSDQFKVILSSIFSLSPYITSDFTINNPSMFLRIHSSWKVQSLILVSCTSIGVRVAFLRKCQALPGRLLGLRLGIIE
jgi:hypothetical protein